jgi:hypothetical protein
VATASVKGTHGAMKQIAYFYNAKLRDDETDIDLNGDFIVPERGQTLLRPDGKYWKVEAVTQRYDGENAVTAHLVYLVPAK